MPNRKNGTRNGPTARNRRAAAPNLEERVRNLERRVTALESKLRRPGLVEMMNEPVHSGVKSGHEVAEETVYVHDVEKPAT